MGQALLTDISDIDGYFTISIIQYSDNHDKKEFNETRYPVRTCREEDFGESEYSKKIFASWKNYVLVCPDIKDNE